MAKDFISRGDLRLIPLAELRLSPLNSRQEIAAEEVEAMAESLAVAGLLQNLIGHLTPEGVEIVGGGTRLRALQRLAAEGWSRHADLIPIDPVPVKVTADLQEAVAWAGTENSARSALHPADEVRAYAAMRERGASLSRIARSFARSEAHVERRLKLADLPAEALAALRANEISLEMAKALTLAPSGERCLEVLGSVRGRDVRPEQVRRELTPGTVPSTDRRAVFVGLEAYLAAGGTSQRDLFADRTLLEDEALLDRLFAEKGAAEAERIRAEEGWEWATWVPEEYVSWTVTQKLVRLYARPGKLSEGEEAELAALEEREAEDALDEAGRARMAELEARREGGFTDAQRTSAGIFVYCSSRDGLSVERAYQLPRAVPRGAAEAAPDLPQSLIEDLHRIRLGALQARLMDQSELMLDLLAFSLGGGLRPWARPLAISPTDQPIAPEKADGTSYPPRLAARLEPNTSLGPDGTPAEFEAFRSQGKKHRNQILTEALARTFCTGSSGLSGALARQLGVEVRRIWTPTAQGFLGRCSANYLDRLWSEFVPAAEADPAHQSFQKLKKGEKAKRLEALFVDPATREALGLSREDCAKIDAWVPAELDWPEAAR
ncbi:chromosome partitioning protein ParB [Rhodobacter sphaeroides]|uniref:ParB/RepB/Spo0J family partition protein n=1 Tax=Cereibacter sphaeroides TaxID=1063 RepID=UPI001326C43C|nr:ParB/RepB/Spo0J family partition protein [Cereibacter sphaeroides]MWP40007.1 chromosome partitioning protein ParB [Cereibacter sphaeroides]